MVSWLIATYELTDPRRGRSDRTRPLAPRRRAMYAQILSKSKVDINAQDVFAQPRGFRRSADLRCSRARSIGRIDVRTAIQRIKPPRELVVEFRHLVVHLRKSFLRFS